MENLLLFERTGSFLVLFTGRLAQLAVGRPTHLLQGVTSFLAVHGIS